VTTYTLIAEEAAPAPGTPDAAEKQGSPYTLFIMMALIFGVFYFLLIRPQQKKQKTEQSKKAEMLKSLRKSDHVMTLGGIYGVVAAVSEDEVVIKVDEKNDVRVRVARDYISKVITDEDEDEDKEAAGAEKKLPDAPEKN